MKVAIFVALSTCLASVAIANVEPDNGLVIQATEVPTDPLFTFMKKRQMLELLKDFPSLDSKDQKELPHGKLFQSIMRKANELGEKEAAPFKNDKEFQAKYAPELIKLAKPKSFDEFVATIRAVSQHTPALAQVMEIMNGAVFDLQKLFSDLTQTHFDIFMLIQGDAERSLVETLMQSGLTPDEFKDISRQVFASELEEFNQFVEANKEFFDRVLVLANNNFMTKVQKCKIIGKKEFCTEGERQIEQLAEITPYVLSEIGSTRAIEAPKDL